MDEPLADDARGRRACPVGIIGLIASSDTMSNVDKVLTLVGRGTKLTVGPRCAERYVAVHVTS